MSVFEESEREQVPAAAGTGPEGPRAAVEIAAELEQGGAEDQLIAQLIRFEHYVMKSCQVDVFAQMAELDLSISQLRALFVLDTVGEQAVHELAEGLGLSVAATGRAVDVLARLGLVSRREDELDRRVKRIALTDPGRGVIGELASARRAGLLKMVGLLDGEEREQLSAVLQRVLAHPEITAFERRHPVGD